MGKVVLLGFALLFQTSFASIVESWDQQILHSNMMRQQFNFVTDDAPKTSNMMVLADDAPEVLHVRELIKNIEETHLSTLLKKWYQVCHLLGEISHTAPDEDHRWVCQSKQSSVEFNLKLMQRDKGVWCLPSYRGALTTFITQNYPSVAVLWQRIDPLSLEKPADWDARLEVLRQETAPILGESYSHVIALFEMDKSIQNIDLRRSQSSALAMCEELAKALEQREDLPARLVCDGCAALMRKEPDTRQAIWYCLKMTKACLAQSCPAPQILADLYREAKDKGTLMGPVLYPHEMIQWDNLLKKWPININNLDPLGAALRETFRHEKLRQLQLAIARQGFSFDVPSGLKQILYGIQDGQTPLVTASNQGENAFP
ncbi:MAG: hypothetical protein C0514_06405 [Candidatus Puniceispirillum sp.]|nr:hypothetical protein [Candidatus Puniceispirillum sp.]